MLAQEIVTGGSLQFVEAVVFALLFLALFRWIAGRISIDSDRPWLQRFVGWGYLAKVVGALARFWMVTELYEAGDSYSYHLAGQRFADTWRDLVVPTSSAGGQGTAFTEVTTGLFYALYKPTFLGGFLMFATLAFVGQLLFYTAFRRWFGPRKQRLYALGVFFLPSLVFWPSSVGKDALMVLFLGIAAYGASRLLSTYRIFGSSLIIALGLFPAAGVRPHVAGMFAIALVLGVLLGRAPESLRGSPKKPVILVGAVAGAALVLGTFSTTFQVGIDADSTQNDIGGFLDDVSQQTAQGGSQIEGVAITTPSRLPIAVVTVLFRPVIIEGTNAQMLASALEGTAMLALVIWKFPQMWRNKGLLRRKAYLMMCFFYTGGFIIGFSAILNLGIMARQRVQLLPLFLALVVGLGWPEEETEEDREGELADFEEPQLPPRQPAYLALMRSGGTQTTEPAEEGEPEETNSLECQVDEALTVGANVTVGLEAETVASSEAQGDDEAPLSSEVTASAEAETVASSETQTDDEAPGTSEVTADLDGETVAGHKPQVDHVLSARTEEAQFRPPERINDTDRRVRYEPRLRDRIRPQVVELRTNDPSLSIREIARRVEASPTTVRRVLVEENLN
jgi:hypothetical protein